MAIEFRCPQCGKLLRTADNTAGKQAKCPACGTVVTIPQAGAKEGESFGLAPPASPLPSQGEPRPAPQPQQPTGGEIPGFSDNPFASPAAPAGGYGPGPVTALRAGPPWERDGASVTSYVETVKQAYTATFEFFSEMRREGGLGMPIYFYLVGPTIATLIGAMLQFALQAGLGIAAMPPGMGGGAPQMVGFGVGMICALVILIPICLLMFILLSFIHAGLRHLMLMILGGANHPFEATFRVVSYSMGNAYLLSFIPFCGAWIGLVAQIVFEIIGLSRVQEISIGKSVAAVLIPFAVCCGTCSLIYFAIIASVIAGFAQ